LLIRCKPMAERYLLYYITDRTAFPGGEPQRRRRLLEKIAEAARCRVDFIQLREKDLTARDLEQLAQDALRVVRKNPLSQTRVLVNSRTDVALAAGADGVHLRSDDVSASAVRSIWAAHKPHNQSCVIGVSCHSVLEVAGAAAQAADFAVFGPVFGKKDAPSTTPIGTEELRRACQQKIPVLALGGVTLDNVGACLDAGAAGIAAIRLFQDQDIGRVVRAIRGC